MESNGGMPGSMLPGMGSGMLGLEVPPHQQQHHHLQQQQLSSFASSLVHDANTSHHHPQQPQPQQKHPYGMPMTTKATAAGKQQMSFSDEEETASGYIAEDGNGGPGDGRAVKKASPWQRMKWTDDMVRLLIMVVFFVGDDAAGLDSGTGDKKKPGGSGGGMLQKKGKWKSVSKAMLDRGYYVSPQQCEDKFNDLNKRYKRVNDILGKGTACRVVENQSLLETMDHISPKMKEEVRKLLNSKHLFFKEMCAYHSSCTDGHHPCEADAPAIVQQLQQQQLSRPQNPPCFNQDMVPIHKEAEDENEHDDDDGEDDDEEEDEEEDDGGDGYENEAGGEEKRASAKRLRRSSGNGSVSSLSTMLHQLNSELASELQDAGKTVWERRQWIRSRSLLLEEEKVRFQSQAFELEKQRFKWQKFSRKKERELQRMKLENERMRLDNERMLLVLRQKEVEIDGMIKRSEPSSITG
ncbi:trihelix transcription factor DF1-like [Nymphaea colorata]|uniref:Myb/SANT-like DNA-binding domain-containing protein n=1 Tax=Nymphaea colorata TaxID=210225 RepID=A0A5K1EH40_9MAGN|nr:trihelix transcription factor DF1-like [Nymphaea colorata]